jgi:hypothetical protein
MDVPQYLLTDLAVRVYAGLASAGYVEDAVQAFRQGLVETHPAGEGLPDWGIPAVFSNTASSRVFDGSQPDPRPYDFPRMLSDYRAFVGRAWLDARFDAFRGRCGEGIFLLEALPGLGKTAWMVELMRHHPDRPCFFFRATVNLTDPGTALLNLAQQLRAFWKILPPTPAQRPDPPQEFAQALAEAASKARREGKVAVVALDALDESRPDRSSGKRIDQLLPVQLPAGAFLLLTTRPGPIAEALRRRPDVEWCEFSGVGAENLRDAGEFCRQELKPWSAGQPEARLNALAARLACKAGANFLVLRLFFRVDAPALYPDLERLEPAIETVTPEARDRYEEFFNRVAADPALDPAGRTSIRQVVRALVTAGGAVNDLQVCTAFGLDSLQWEDAFARLRQFLAEGGLRQQRGGRPVWRIYHDTFREYLLERLAADLLAGHRAWARYAAEWRARTEYDRWFSLAVLPSQQRKAGEWDALRETLLDFEFLEAKADTEGIGIYELLADFLDARRSLPEERDA